MRMLISQRAGELRKWARVSYEARARPFFRDFPSLRRLRDLLFPTFRPSCILLFLLKARFGNLPAATVDKSIFDVQANQTSEKCSESIFHE